MMQPIPISNETEYTFRDEEFISATEKWHILADWQRFLLSGFKQLFFTRALYAHLTQHGGYIAHYGQEQFWNIYFNSDLSRLRACLNQFGGERQAAEGGGHHWLDGKAADLNTAMCIEAERIVVPLNQVLHDLEIKQVELVEAWRAFSVAAGISDVPLPTPYQVSENTRNLLAYAAQIALRQQRPLAGLQLRFPLEESLLQEVSSHG